MYNLLRAVLALAACVPLSTAQVVSSPAPQNPPITYDAFSTLSVEERYNVTVYYTTTTIYGISTTIIVGDIVTNPTNATDAPCPTNFFSPTPGPYVTPGECIYCPSTGWYSTEPNACSMSMYLVGGCQSGYFVAGTQTPGGTYLNSIDCLPITVPVPIVPDCPSYWVTSGDFCVLPSIQPTVRIDSYTTTTVTRIDGQLTVFTYDDYTYVYASGVNTSDVGGSFTSTPFGYYTGPITTITTNGQTYTEAVGVPASIYLQATSSGTAVVAAPGQTSSDASSPATSTQGISSGSSASGASSASGGSVSSSLSSASVAGMGSGTGSSSSSASSVASAVSGSSGSVLVTSESSSASGAGGSAVTEVVTSVSTVGSGSASGNKVTVVVTQTTKGQGSGSGSGESAASAASSAASSVPAFQGAAAGVQMMGGLGMLVVLAAGVLGVVMVL